MHFYSIQQDSLVTNLYRLIKTMQPDTKKKKKSKIFLLYHVFNKEKPFFELIFWKKYFFEFIQSMFHLKEKA